MIHVGIDGSRAGRLHQGDHVSPSLAQLRFIARQVMSKGTVDPVLAAWHAETG